MLIVFAVTLLVASLLSSISSRSVLSSAVLFFGAGLAISLSGHAGLDAQDEPVVLLVEATLFAVLFTDAMHVGLDDLRSAWRLPSRALLFGMPLIFVATTGLGHYLVGLSWPAAMLVSAVLLPTDPVTVSAILRRKRVPPRLRFMLGVEAGVNDGLALPAVLILAATLSRSDTDVLGVLGELGAGVVVGLTVPLLVRQVMRIPRLSVVGAYEKILGVAVGVAVFSICRQTGANPFLGAFAAGVTLRTAWPDFARSFDDFGDVVSEMIKLLGLFIFAVIIDPQAVASLPPVAWLFAVLVLLAARPLAMGVSLLASPLGAAERLTVGWFGPKGFASVFLGILVLQAGIPEAERLFAIISVVIGISIVVHSSTDVLVAGFFGRRAREEEQQRSDAEPKTEETGAHETVSG